MKSDARPRGRRSGCRVWPCRTARAFGRRNDWLGWWMQAGARQAGPRKSPVQFSVDPAGKYPRPSRTKPATEKEEPSHDDSVPQPVSAASAAGCPCASGRRIQQGRRHDGHVCRRRRGRHGGDLHRRLPRRHPEPGDGGRSRTPNATWPAPAGWRWTGRPRILGVRQRWLGFVDSGLPEGDPLPPLPAGSFATAAAWSGPRHRWSGWCADFKPHVIVSYDENGGYPHPDHIMAHRVAVEAFDAAGDPDRYPGDRRARGSPASSTTTAPSAPTGSAPCTSRLRKPACSPRTPSASPPGSRPTPKGHTPPPPTHPTTTQIECGDFFEARDDALRAHRTQVDP